MCSLLLFGVASPGFQGSARSQSLPLSSNGDVCLLTDKASPLVRLCAKNHRRLQNYTLPARLLSLGSAREGNQKKTLDQNLWTAREALYKHLFLNRNCQWKHPVMKPKLALKLVPTSGLLFDLHTAHYARFGVAKLHTLNNTNQSGGEKNTEPMSFFEARFQLKKESFFAPWKTLCHGSTARGAVFRSHSSTAPCAIQWKHPLMKPKLALKLVPTSGLVFDLHTAHYAHFGVAKLHTLNNTNQSGGENNILKTKKNKRKTKSNTRQKKNNNLRNLRQLDRTKMVPTRKEKAETAERHKKLED